MQLSDRAPSTSTSVLVTLPFSDHMSLLTLYFPEETNEYGTSAEIADTIDEAILRDEYSDEMLMVDMSQITMMFSQRLLLHSICLGNLLSR